jgi:hypothetical protein
MVWTAAADFVEGRPFDQDDKVARLPRTPVGLTPLLQVLELFGGLR